MYTVLVVDDDPDTLAANCEALGSRYAVLAATTGEDALRMARAVHPDVIMLDVMLTGGQDGFTVFRELRRDPATRHIPVIFLTNINQTTGLPFGCDALDRYLGSHPAAFLEKPVSAGKLLKVVTKFVDALNDGPDAGGKPRQSS